MPEQIMTNFIDFTLSILMWLMAKGERGWAVYVESLPSMASNLMWLLVIAATAFLIEAITVGWAECSLRKVLQLSGTVKNDLFSLFMNYSGLGNYIALLMTFCLIYFPVKHIRSEWLGTPLFQFDSTLTAGLIYIIASDFSMYWFHRLSHRWKTLWKVHAYHHSASRMTILSGAREHPLIFQFTSVWMIIPTALIAPQQEAGWLLVILVLTRIHGLLIHSNITSSWGWLGQYILASPAMHRIHHGVADQYHNRNFGSLLILWDRLFGTWEDPRCIGDAHIEVGLSEIAGDGSPPRYLAQTYLAFLTSLFSPLGNFFKASSRRLKNQ